MGHDVSSVVYSHRRSSKQKPFRFHFWSLFLAAGPPPLRKEFIIEMPFGDEFVFGKSVGVRVEKSKTGYCGRVFSFRIGYSFDWTSQWPIE